jgi:hypothetical protein
VNYAFFPYHRFRLTSRSVADQPEPNLSIDFENADAFTPANRFPEKRQRRAFLKAGV